MTVRRRLVSALVAVVLLVPLLLSAFRVSEQDWPAADARLLWPSYCWLAVAAGVRYAVTEPTRAVDPRRWRAALTAAYWLGSGALSVFAALALQIFPDRFRWYEVVADVLAVLLGAASIGDGVWRWVALSGRAVPAPASLSVD